METSPGKRPDVWQQMKEFCEQDGSDCDGSGGEDDESSNGSDDGDGDW